MLARRQDSEHLQAMVRILFSAIFLPFIATIYVTGQWGGVSVYALYTTLFFCGAALAILAAILISPEPSPHRRLVGMFVDIVSCTLLLITGDTAGSIAFGSYFWVTIGNGLRYGSRYLRIAHITCIAAFTLVLILGDYWRQNIVLGISLLGWLFLLPLFVSTLTKKLEDTVEKAEQANKAKSAFLANMSHEIRTPLTAIIGYAEISLDSTQTPEERTLALNTIMRSGNHLLNIINDILDFSKVEADRLDMEFLAVNPFQVVHDVESLVKSLVDRKNLAFNVHYDLPLPTQIRTDPVRLEQILLNLCNNAVKFTDKGAIDLHIRCDRDQQRIYFSVVDTGIGMTKEQSANLFVPFKQADSSTTRRYGGTGLGLSLSKRLAEKLDGIIEVRSEYGHGSCFSLAIATGPLDAVPLIYHTAQIRLASDNDSKPVNHGQLAGQVLLAEDNETIQQLLSLFLRKMGVSVTIAGSGEAAVRLARARHYDLILMDMQMPVMSGVDAVKMLRQEGYAQPIIALTANATTEDKTTCLAAGCNDFLAKPVAREQLYTLTARYVSSAPRRNSTEEPIISKLLREEPSFQKLVEDFVAELPEILRNIRVSWDKKDWIALKTGLHDLKGMGGGFGYQVLTDLALKAEKHLANEDFPSMESALEEMDLVNERIFQGISLDGKNIVELTRT